MNEPNLWHINRRSAAGALAVGLFMAWMPIPFQMVFAAGFAIFFQVNLPLSVVLVWITNPVTMPVMFYLAYKLGSILLGEEVDSYHFELSFSGLIESFSQMGPAFFLGCLVLGVLSAALGFGLGRLLWRYSVLFNRKKTLEKRRKQP
ncbi:ATP-binding protein [Paraferrimonas sedimenticola]|uniref:ATP-binding protein n=1 Tax=Paraferrimonas sedimenticola TaxID=375674 RepID=A0AA37RUL3_9GAMM|nr:ATP-binding protein [Paraferrimonas sedimenticola]